jgi:hypothetical protein
MKYLKRLLLHQQYYFPTVMEAESKYHRLVLLAMSLAVQDHTGNPEWKVLNKSNWHCLSQHIRMYYMKYKEDALNNFYFLIIEQLDYQIELKLLTSATTEIKIPSQLEVLFDEEAVL